MNQEVLYKQIEQTTSDENCIISRYSELELSKGRLERRAVFVSNNLSGISEDWVGLEQIIKIQRRTKRAEKWHEEVAYYISSKETNAREYCDGIRSHWEIENSLHWIKDVTFREDASKIRTQNAPENMTTFRNLAINIFRKNGFTNMAQAKRLVTNNIHQLCQLIL